MIETEKIKALDCGRFTQRVTTNLEKCYFCGSKETYDIMTIDDIPTFVYFFRPIDNKTRAVCRKHHFMTVKIDNMVSGFIKILYKFI